MSFPTQDPPPYGASLHPSRHASKPSVDTNASGIADSTISFSAFPPPPTSIPSTPITTTAPSSFPSRSGLGSPIRPLYPRKNGSVGGRPLPDPLSATSAGSGTTLTGTSRPIPQTYSKTGWNDGASQISGISGISVDAAEDRLLPTSFITSLLQENKETRQAQRRKSTASDALSGISEMTYPPPEDTSRYRTFRAQPSRLGVSPAPPSSFAPIAEVIHPHRISSDSETLASVQGYSAGKSPFQRGPSVVGVAHASYRKIPEDPSPNTAQTFPRSVSGHGHEKGGSWDEEDDDSIMQYKAALEPRIAPLTSFNPTHRRVHSRNHQYSNNPDARQSVHSFKSVAPSFISRISIPNSIKRFIHRRRDPKPLPPVPIIPDIPLAIEAQYRRQDEAAPLPELVNRAGQLQSILEKEQNFHHHHGIGTFVSSPKSETSTTQSRHTYGTHSSSWQPLRRRDVVDPDGTPPAPTTLYFGAPYESHGTPTPRNSRWCSCLPKFTRRLWIMVGVAFILVLIVTIVVPVVVTKKSHARSKCESGVAGSLCNLNANCVCTGTSGTCNGLAQSIIDLIPLVNDNFLSNFTNSDVYTSFWYAQGTTGTKDCSEQAWLLDTGKSLSVQTYPSRTRWTQAALLWNVVQSQDIEEASSMQKFVSKLPWSDLGDDGPTDAQASIYTSTFAGYTYNFAKQTVSQPSTTFVDGGQPLNAQIARVGAKALATLDRMYTYASASSAQREAALNNYWTTTLAQRVEDLATFKGVLSRSQILLPFNGSSVALQSLYNSSSLLFPPPLSCYPGFSPELMSLVQTFETTVFDLDSPTAASSFDTACFPDRPIYGILDLLRLRLPFLEDRPWLPRQAAVLKLDALPRAVIYVNEMMSATFPGSTPRAKFTQSELDPRNFGTLTLSNHVILQYLSSMPVETAKALAQFTVSAVGKPALPPDPSSPLYQRLSSVPPLEVAIFGNVGPTDVSGTVTSFMAANGSFFFGTEAGSALRNWSITTAGGSVTWAENSTSPRIVRDNSLADATIDQAWRAVAGRLNDKTVGLSNLTVSFEQTQKFSSS
ncbi:hypothetical protein NMY22_g1587 [Coprinellus aureogranulatus]|nr:hypothetical protein NMY22_g1587 [Coprinellus aureogranulatus]